MVTMAFSYIDLVYLVFLCTSSVASRARKDKHVIAQKKEVLFNFFFLLLVANVYVT